jgi:hypothetical protein
MNIKDVKYVKNSETNKNSGLFAVINGRECAVPLDPANADYQEILKQVKEGTLTIQDAD